jgi:hypothetical protein
MHPKLIITCSSGIAVQAPSLMRVLLGRVSWADSLTTGFFCVGALGFVRCAFLCLLTLLALRGQSGTVSRASPPRTFAALPMRQRDTVGGLVG